ncbi:MAG: DUF1571 domain-containing protein [Pirellulaceae bacterium]|nr:DUF1571 domain-containing protein [Pirellulaceae bacterium]
MARFRSRVRSARLNIPFGVTFGILIVVLMAVSFYILTTDATNVSLNSVGTRTFEEEDSLNADQASSISGFNAASPHPLDPVLVMARRELEAFSSSVVDYTAVMHKRERINGKLGEENQMFVKIINDRQRETEPAIPLHVYLRFDSPASMRGREVIWIDGKNDGNLIAHEAGFMNLMSVQLAPTGSLAMMGNKYPITGIGMANLYKKLIEKGERDRRNGNCEVTFREHEIVNSHDVAMIEVKHPAKYSHFDFHIARVYLDLTRHLPLRYEAYLWPENPGDEPPLEEQYTYSDIRLNVGLTEKDFDPENEEYQYP